MSAGREPCPDADPHLCSRNIGARAASAKISEPTHQLLILADTEKRPFGTLTEGFDLVAGP